MWEIADVAATPRLAEALAALGDSRTDRSFDFALEGFLAHARRTLEARGAHPADLRGSARFVPARRAQLA